MSSNAIDREAARWFTRMQTLELPGEKTVTEWHQWMSLDPRHAAAFARLEQVWDEFEVLPRPALLPREIVESDVYDGSMPIQEWNQRNRAARLHRRRRFAYAMAASFVVTVGIVSALLAVNTGRSEELNTRVGENRTVRLLDGSQIVMGGQTNLRIEWLAQERRVILVRGEAVFTVVKDLTRPFRVQAGSATVTAVGTQFNVRRSEDHVTVSVLEGRVTVQPLRSVLPVQWLEKVAPALKHGTVKSLDAGQEASVDRHGAGRIASPADISVATSWVDGRLSFDDEPLRYAVESVNRYSEKPIVIGDPTIEDVRVSGTVLGGHIHGWVTSLDAAFALTAVERDGEIVLSRRR